MIQRCTNQKNKYYKNYGGRGIAVCDRWAKDFLAFFEDMGEAPLGHSIERIDNNLGYFKENCRWASKAEQDLNKRSNVEIFLDGEKTIVAEALRRLKIPRSLYVRYSYRPKHNMTPQQIIDTLAEQARGAGGITMRQYGDRPEMKVAA